jgi:hypothetical protein
MDRAIERLKVLDGALADRSVTWLGSERDPCGVSKSAMYSKSH